MKFKISWKHATKKVFSVGIVAHDVSNLKLFSDSCALFKETIVFPVMFYNVSKSSEHSASQNKITKQKGTKENKLLFETGKVPEIGNQ